MASINISELRPVGSELFQDNESFLNELNDQEMSAAIGGGGYGGVGTSVISQNSISLGVSIVSQSLVTQSLVTFGGKKY